MNDSLGDRMKKNYENVSRHYLTRRMPVIVRCDARAFHTFTKHCERPFDENIISAMIYAAQQVAISMQGFQSAYIQSDEASFLITDYSDLETQGWFDYNLNKIVSISASIMSVSFNYFYRAIVSGKIEEVISKNQVENWGIVNLSDVHFDSRAFNVPREDVANYFKWRQDDWERNSLQMYTRSFYSHSQLENKNREDMHEMLFAKGKNWTKDLSDTEKNGTFLIRTENGIIKRSDILPNYADISKVIEPLVYPAQKVVAAVGYGLTDEQQRLLRAMKDSLELRSGE